MIRPFRAAFPLLSLLSSLLVMVISCSPKETPQRGLASEDASVAAVHLPTDTPKHLYNLASIHKTLALKGPESPADPLTGFLAASAEEVLKAHNLEKLIAANADRACVFLGQIHGLEHRHAVHFETSEQVGPMISPVNGGLSQQRALPISNHDALAKFCKKASQEDFDELAHYREKCLAAQSIEVMPIHFTSLECDNTLNASAGEHVSKPRSVKESQSAGSGSGNKATR